MYTVYRLLCNHTYSELYYYFEYGNTVLKVSSVMIHLNREIGNTEHSKISTNGANKEAW